MQPRLRLALFLAGLFALTAVAGGAAVRRRRQGRAGRRVRKAPCGRRTSRRRTSGCATSTASVVTLADLRGTPVVVTFLYTTCEDTCPLTVDQIRGGLDELGHDVPVVAVSVDPANDTPRAAKRFSLRAPDDRPDALGPRRARRSSSGCGRAYGVQPQSDKLEHSASTVLLDGRGRQRVGFSTSVLTPRALAHDIALLEREGALGRLVDRRVGAPARPRRPPRGGRARDEIASIATTTSSGTRYSRLTSQCPACAIGSRLMSWPPTAATGRAR